MPLRRTTIGLLLAAAAILVLWMAGKQRRLEANYDVLQGKLAALERAAGGDEWAVGRERALGAPSALPETPRGDAALRAKMKKMEKQIEDLREHVDRREQVPGRVSISSLLATSVPQGKVSLDDPLIQSGGRSWGHEQVLGPPNTEQLGDYSTAWAPKAQNGGAEWLQVDFDKAVSLSEINVHESYNPGAISQVVAMLPDGSEKVIWEGEFGQESPGGVIERAFQVDDSITAGSVKIYMDTTRVNGWNEIDAVEIVGDDDSRQWASSVSASSSYAR